MDGERQMFKGDWSCASCNTAIGELPFEPRDTSNLLCRDCHKEQRGNRDSGPRREKKMFQGDWKCNECSTAITELPFEPRDESNLMCRDCFKKSKGF